MSPGHSSDVPGGAQTCWLGGQGYRMKDAAAALGDKVFIELVPSEALKVLTVPQSNMS